MSTVDPKPLSLKNGTTHYGRFYPLGYVVAFFAEASQREQAIAELIQLKWVSDELISTSGQDLAELRQDIRDNRSLWAALVSKFAEKDRVLDGAEKGEYHVLLVYAPEQRQIDIVRGVLENLAVLAQSYSTMTFSQLPLPNGQPS